MPFLFKVIPLKLFYCQFFFKLGVMTSMIWASKMQLKNGSLCLFTHQRALKMGYFYWLRVKIFESPSYRIKSTVGYLEDAKVYLESRASFIDIRSIALFKLFLIVWSNMFFIRLFLANTWTKNRGSPCSLKRKGEFFCYRAWFEEISYAHVRVLSWKLCAVGMCNAILRNYLNYFNVEVYSTDWVLSLFLIEAVKLNG